MLGFDVKDVIKEICKELRELRRSVTFIMQHMLRKDIQVANDLTRLNAAVAALEAKVAAMPPSAPDVSVEIDAAAARVEAATAAIPPTTP